MTSRWIVAGVLIASGGWMLACRHHAQADVIALPLSPDRLVGIVSVTGTGFEQHVMLRTDDRVVTLIVKGDDSASLVRVGGAEVLVHGRAFDSQFGVSSFTVLSVDGAHVEDGILLREDGRLALRSRIHQLTLGNPPPALDSLVGARIWIGGPFDTGPNVYGVIAPAP